MDGVKYRNPSNEHPACRGNVDLVIIVKWPGGLDKYSWSEKIAEYLPKFVSQLEISENRFRVGLIMSHTYDKDFLVDLNGEHSLDKTKLLEEVEKSVNVSNFVIGTKLEKMLNVAYLMFKKSKRLNTVKMIYLISDGMYISDEEVEKVLNKVRAYPIQVYVQGIGETSKLWLKPHMGCTLDNSYPCPNFMYSKIDEPLEPKDAYTRMCLGMPQNAVCFIQYGEFNSCKLPCSPYSVKSALATSYTTLRGPTFGYVGFKPGVDCKMQAHFKDMKFKKCTLKDCMTDEEYAEYLNNKKKNSMSHSNS